MTQSPKPTPAMQRPVMNPTFEKLEVHTAKIGVYWQHFLRGAKWFGRSLLSNPFAIASTGQARPSGAKIAMRMAVSWGLFIPTVTILSCVGLVIHGTHPAPPPALLDPNSQGCYFETVSFAAEDGTQLTGWLIPVIDARRVLSEKDKILKSRRPGVVLAHDTGQSPQQMLPLVRPLHDEGVNLIIVALRGSGPARSAGATFGINEAKDLAAAVAFLRRTPFVDPNRIAIAGIGAGANAALLAAAKDSTIKSLVIANPVKNCDQAIKASIAPRGAELAWMEPLCKWTFQLMYSVDSDDLNYDRSAPILKAHPSLIFDTGNPYVLADQTNVQRIRMFCRKNLSTQDRPAIGSAR
jgi:hypothetical protein